MEPFRKACCGRARRVSGGLLLMLSQRLLLMLSKPLLLMFSQCLLLMFSKVSVIDVFKTHTHNPFFPSSPSHTQEELPKQIVWKYEEADEEIATSATLPCHLWDTVAKKVVYVQGLDPQDTKVMLTGDDNKKPKKPLRRCTEEELPADAKLPDIVHASTSTQSPRWQPCRFDKPSVTHVIQNHL